MNVLQCRNYIHVPFRMVLKECSLMSGGKSRTVTPPNRSTFPAKTELAGCPFWSWNCLPKHEKGRNALCDNPQDTCFTFCLEIILAKAGTKWLQSRTILRYFCIRFGAIFYNHPCCLACINARSRNCINTVMYSITYWNKSIGSISTSPAG